MNEPSLLDYLAARLRVWRAPPADLPGLRQLWRDETSARATAPAPGRSTAGRPVIPTIRLERGPGPIPWALAGAVVSALAAQAMFDPSGPPVLWAAAALLVSATVAVVMAVHRGEVAVPVEFSAGIAAAAERGPRRSFLAAAAVAAAVVGISAADNAAGPLLVVVWLAAVVLVVAGFAPPSGDCVGVWHRVRSFIDRDRWSIGVDPTTMLVAGCVALAALVRSRALARVPAEMVSRHAELLLSILMVSPAGGPIVFPFGIGGTEPLPVYVGAALAPLTGGIAFACLKLGALLAGLATLPFIYLLGRDLAGRPAGLAATALAAVGLWPDLVSRVGFEGSWYPPFAAAALWLLVRAIDHGRRRDFVAAGVVIGLAIQTVSVARSLLVAAVILVAAGWWSADRHRRRRLATGLLVLLIVAVVAGLPTIVASAAASGGGIGWWLGAADGVRDGSAMAGFAGRALRCVLSPLWSDGQLWIHGGGDRPALDRVAAALFVVGAALTAVAAVRRRAPGARLIVLSVPLLMLPAILSPLEAAAAPSPVRCGGAIAPVFVLAGIGLAALASSVAAALAPPVGRRAAAVVAVLVVALSASAGRAVVLGSFAEVWDRSAWNASELGETVRAATSLGVPVERAWVVPFPHWVDTRLVAFEAGLPGLDLALDPNRVAETAGRAGPKLFLVHPEDRRTLRTLADTMPAAIRIPRTSRVGGKGFLAVVELGMSGGS